MAGNSSFFSSKVNLFYCNPIRKITNAAIVIRVQAVYLPAISQSDGSA